MLLFQSMLGYREKIVAKRIGKNRKDNSFVTPHEFESSFHSPFPTQSSNVGTKVPIVWGFDIAMLWGEGE